MTTLYLVRHGETVDNAAQIMQGQTHGRLTGRGEEQARELARRLAGEHFDAFVSSDLQRVVDTAQIIAGGRGAVVRVTPLLRERDWGSFTGRFIPSLKGEPWSDDIETMDEMKARAARFIDFIRSEYPDKRVLAVGHGIINKAIQSVFYNRPTNKIERMENAEIRVLEL